MATSSLLQCSSRGDLRATPAPGQLVERIVNRTTMAFGRGNRISRRTAEYYQ
jgi:hypothetical protein